MAGTHLGEGGDEVTQLIAHAFQVAVHPGGHLGLGARLQGEPGIAAGKRDGAPVLAPRCPAVLPGQLFQDGQQGALLPVVGDGGAGVGEDAQSFVLQADAPALTGFVADGKPAGKLLRSGQRFLPGLIPIQIRAHGRILDQAS